MNTYDWIILTLWLLLFFLSWLFLFRCLVAIVSSIPLPQSCFNSSPIQFPPFLPFSLDTTHSSLGTMLGAILTLNEWEQEEHIPKSWDHLENPPDVRFLSSRLDPAVFRRMTMPDTFIFAAQHVLSRHKDKFEGKWWDLWCAIHPLASEDDPTEHLGLPAGAPIDFQDLSSRFNLRVKG